MTNRERAEKAVMSVYEHVGGDEYLAAFTLMELMNSITAALKSREAK